MKTSTPLFLALLLGLAPLLHAQSPYASLQIPQQIQYQGRVSQNGAAWSGEGYFVFALIENGTILWNNWEGTYDPSTGTLTDPGAAVLADKFTSVQVTGGAFAIRLGSQPSASNKPILATAFFNAQTNSVRSGVKLAAWFSPDSQTFSRLSPDVELSSVPYAMVSGVAEAVKERAVTQGMMASTAGVPVGGVISWWGTAASIPAGFEICDGNAATTAGTQFTGNKPDLRGRFPRGAESARADVQSAPFTGGIDTIAPRNTGGTAITIAQMPAHNHGGATGTQNVSGIHDAVGNRTVRAGSGGGAYGVQDGGSQSTSGQLLMDAHTHSIASQGSGQAHDHTIAAQDNRPAYLELFYIIRVK